jgi:hypothetical protein
MHSRDFCYWLQGFFEIAPAAAIDGVDLPISAEQVKVIRSHLALVFKHEIDPSIDGGDPKKKQQLDQIHHGPFPPGGPVMSC